MEPRNSLRSIRVLGVALAAASVAATALVSIVSKGEAAAILPFAFGLPFVAVAVLDGVANHGRHA